MSKQEIISDKVRELKLHLFSVQNGRCFSCGEPVAMMDMEAAHQIPDREWTVKVFGRDVINHPKNFRGTHRGICNSKAQLDPNSIYAETLAIEIKRDIDGLR